LIRDEAESGPNSAEPANPDRADGSESTIDSRFAGRESPQSPQSPTRTSVADFLGSPSSQRADPFPAPLQERDPGRYEILAEHGRGGLGRVYRARDRELGREVALKELLAPSFRSEMRFFREALITARLEHPGVVPVHEAGRWPNGTPFYSMKLVAGRPFDEVIGEARTLDQRLAFLPRLIAVADAIAYAHDRKIIHRDLKPSNVIIGEFGETMVIDWGLAKDLTEAVADDVGDGPYRTPASPEITVAGSVLGTPAYMSPEQARGDRVDTRSDVYSIGTMLFQLLAGEARPIDATPDLRRGNAAAAAAAERSPGMAEMQAEQAATPGLPRLFGSIEAGAPPDLVAIAKKAMARDPDARYATARELAEDLRRFQTGQLVGARQYSPWERLGRWVARRRIVVGAVAVIVAVAIGSFAVVLHQRDRARDAQHQEREARRQAEARRNELTLVQARSALDSDPTAAIAWLKTYPEDGADSPSAHDIAADAVSLGVARHVLRGHISALYRVNFSADGRTVASSGVDHTLRTWDVATGHGVVAARGLAELSVFAYDPHGRWLAHDSDDGTVHLVDLQSGKDSPLGRHQKRIYDLSFSADGGVLVSAGGDGSINLWDVATHKHRELRAPSGVHRARLHTSGKLLASCGVDQQLLVWDVASATRRSLGSCNAARAPGFVFSAGGERLAIGHLDGSIGVWDPEHDTQVTINAQEETPEILSLSGAGDLVATGDSHGNVTVWVTATGDLRARQRVPDAVTWVELSPSGRLLVAGTIRGGLHVYDLSGGGDWQLRGHTDYIAEARFSADETAIASASGDRSVRIWPVPGERPRGLLGHPKGAFHPVWTGDGHVVSVEGEDGTVRSWNLLSGESRVLGKHEDTAFGLVSAGDERLASASWDGTVRLWDLRSGTATVLRGHTGIVHAVAFSPASGLLASSGADGTVRLWGEAGGGRVLGKLEGEVHGLAQSPDGRLVAGGDMAGHVAVWDVRGHAVQWIAMPGDTAYRVLFTRDAASVITAGQSGVVRQWNVSGAPVPVLLHKHTAGIHALSLSPDGRRLASGSDDGSVWYIDLVTRTSHSYTGHVAPIGALAQSPAGGWIASGADDGSIRLVNASSGDSRVLGRHAAPVNGLAFSPDGALLASAAMDGTVRVWSIAGASPQGMAPGVGGSVFRAWLDSITSASLDRRTRVPVATTTPSQ